MQKTVFFLCLCLLLISCADSYEPVYLDAPLKVVVIGGQSNCVSGHTVAEELPRPLQKEQKSLFYSERGWTHLSPTVEEHFGPEISLAWHLSKMLSEPIGIIKHAIGGTNLAEDWFPRSGYCYDALMAKIDAARETRDIEIIAVAWMQGEKDAKYEDMAYAYAENLETLITCLQADCENPELKLVAGRINPPQHEDRPYVDIVRKAQKNCPPPNYAWVDCDDLSKDDVNHYDTAGIVELGKRFAEKLY